MSYIDTATGEIIETGVMLDRAERLNRLRKQSRRIQPRRKHKQQGGILVEVAIAGGILIVFTLTAWVIGVY